MYFSFALLAMMIFNNSIHRTRTRDHLFYIFASDQLERENLNNHFNQLLQR